MRHLPVALQAVLALEPQIIDWAEDFRAWKTPCSWAGACTTRLRWKARSSSKNQLHPRRGLPGRRAQTRPLALVTSAMPVVTVAPNDALLEKLKSNMQEVRAPAACCTCWPTPTPHRKRRRPARDPHARTLRALLSPILHVVPLQLLSRWPPPSCPSTTAVSKFLYALLMGMALHFCRKTRAAAGIGSRRASWCAWAWPCWRAHRLR